MSSYLTATPHQRITAILEGFDEFLPETEQWCSPHLGQFGITSVPGDGVLIGQGRACGKTIYIGAQDGRVMGGSIGEVHGAKLVGLMRRAVAQKPDAVLLLAESGGVRLHEANAGLIAVSEIMRALLEVRAAGISVLVAIGGPKGCFGGMGIIVQCADFIIMSEESRMGMSGPEVIEAAHGVREFDSADRDLVWNTTGGRHRYLAGDCQLLVNDDLSQFAQAVRQALNELAAQRSELTLATLESEHTLLKERLEGHAAYVDTDDIAQAEPTQNHVEENFVDWKKIAAELFPQGHQIVESAQMLTGTAQVDHQLCQVIGTTAHAAIGVEIALAQAYAVLSALRTGAQYPLLLLVDTKGQRLRRRDEVLGINRYMAHLGKCLQLAREQGRKVIALVYDQALSGGFVSSGMMADACYALPGARIWVMDLPAMARITKMPEEQLAALAINNPVFASGSHHFEKMGAIEAIWYGELATNLRTAFTNIDQVDRRSESGFHRGGRLAAQKVMNAILSISESVFTIRNDGCHAE